jgi:hypothetical protein
MPARRGPTSRRDQRRSDPSSAVARKRLRACRPHGSPTIGLASATQIGTSTCWWHLVPRRRPRSATRRGASSRPCRSIQTSRRTGAPPADAPPGAHPSNCGSRRHRRRSCRRASELTVTRLSRDAPRARAVEHPTPAARPRRPSRTRIAHFRIRPGCGRLDGAARDARLGRPSSERPPASPPRARIDVTATLWLPRATAGSRP